jgi:hypothetical protein
LNFIKKGFGGKRAFGRITSSWTKNPPEEWISTMGITSSWTLIHVGKIKMREKSSKR